MNKKSKTKVPTELKRLVKTSNDAYLAFFAALINAPQTPEFNRLRTVLNDLRESVIHAKNSLKAL